MPPVRAITDLGEASRKVLSNPQESPRKCTKCDARHLTAFQYAQRANGNWDIQASRAGDITMFWKRMGSISGDCLMVLVGLAIAAPFFLVLVSPFLGGP